MGNFAYQRLGKMVHTVEDYLKRHPMFGVAFAAWAAIQPFLDSVIPVFAACSAVMGTIVVFYTLRIKLIEYQLKREELLRLKKDLENTDK